MSAREYILTLFQSISDVFSSPPFNACDKGEFPESFMYMCRAIFKKLFRVYAHVYHHHLIVRVVVAIHCRNLQRTGRRLTWTPALSDLSSLNESSRWSVRTRNSLFGSSSIGRCMQGLWHRLVEDEEDNSTPEDLRSVMKRSQNSKSYRHSSTTDSSE